MLIPSRFSALRLLPLYRTTACLGTVVPLIGMRAESGLLVTMNLLMRRERRCGRLISLVTSVMSRCIVWVLGLRFRLVSCAVKGILLRVWSMVRVMVLRRLCGRFSIPVSLCVVSPGR